MSDKWKPAAGALAVDDVASDASERMAHAPTRTERLERCMEIPAPAKVVPEPRPCGGYMLGGGTLGGFMLGSGN